MTQRPLFTRTIRSLVSRLTEQSYVRLGVQYALMIFLFGVIYYCLAVVSPEHGPSIGGGPWYVQLFNAVYYSTITAAAVGYGDISPHGISKIFAALESILSLFVFAILVSKPVSERQEQALYEMHKLTFDEIFTTVREGFFIMRKDFDGIIAELETQKIFSDRSCENLETALHQGQILMEDIPRFYNTERKLYVIDIHREELLGEAVQRTFERLHKTLSMLKNQKIPVSERTHTILQELLQTAEVTLKKWHTHSAKHTHAFIDESVNLIQRMKKLHA